MSKNLFLCSDTSYWMEKVQKDLGLSFDATVTFLIQNCQEHKCLYKINCQTHLRTLPPEITCRIKGQLHKRPVQCTTTDCDCVNFYWCGSPGGLCQCGHAASAHTLGEVPWFYFRVGVSDVVFKQFKALRKTEGYPEDHLIHLLVSSFYAHGGKKN